MLFGCQESRLDPITSTAALASGFTALEIGTDLGGSIRVPASYTGVFGHKASVNVISLRGCVAPTVPDLPVPAMDLIAAGPMARTASDLKLALEVLAGPDPWWDGRGYQLALPSCEKKSLNAFRVLMLTEHPLCPTSHSTQQAFTDFAAKLSQAGATVLDQSACQFDLAEIARCYVTQMGAFVAVMLPNAQYQAIRAKCDDFSQDDDSLSACFFRASKLPYRQWYAEASLRAAMRAQVHEYFKQYDVIVCPAFPTTAPKHESLPFYDRTIEIDGKPVPCVHQTAWISLASLFGLPATVAPIGFSQEGLPIGAQIIGNYLDDLKTIRFAELIEQVCGGFVAPPLVS